MAKKGTIGGKIVLEGEKEYKQALSQISSNYKTLTSEMKLSSAQFKNNANSVDALKSKQQILTRQLEEQKNKINVYKDALANANSNLDKCSTNVSEWKSKLSQAESELEQMKKSTSASNEEIAEQEKKVEQAKRALEQAEGQYDATSNKVNNWTAKLNDAQAEVYNLNNDIQKNEKYLNEAKSSTDGCAKSIDQYGKQVKDAEKDTSTFGDVLKANLTSQAIIGGIKSLANSVKSIGKSLIETGSGFEASMSQVAGTMGMTAEEVNNGSESFTKLADAAKKCGETTKYTAAESAEALNYMALAGYNVEEAVSTLPNVLNLAAAGGIDLASASDMVTDALSALGLTVNDGAGFVDKLAKTSQKSNTSVAQLGEALLTVGGTAKTLRGGVTEANTAIGILSDNGIKGAEAGTKLRNIILALTPTTDKAKDAFKELGVETYASDGSLRSINDTFLDLNDAMSELTDEDKTRLLNDIFNKADLSAANALLSNCGDRFNELSGYINNADGAAQAMSDTLNNNLKGDLTIMDSAIDGVKTTIYECFSETFRDSVQDATSEFGKLNDRIKNGDLKGTFQRLSIVVADLAKKLLDAGINAIPKVASGLEWIVNHGNEIKAAIIGIATALILNKAISGVTTLVSAFQSLKTAIQATNTVTSLLTSGSGIGLIISLVGGAAAAIYALTDNTEEVNEELQEFADNARDAAEKADEFRQSVSDTNINYDDSISSIQATADTAKELTDELFRLQEQSNLTSDEQSRMSQIVDQLNQLYPGLNLQVQEHTNKVNMTKDAIYGVVEAMKKQAIQEAGQALYTEQTKKLLESRVKLKEAQEDLTEKEKLWGEALDKELEEAAKNSEDWKSSFGYMSQSYKDAHAEANKYGEAVTAAENSVKAYTDAENEAQDAINRAKGVLSEYYTEQGMATDATGELTEATQENAEATAEASDEIQQAYEEAKQAAAESIEGQLDLWSAFEKGTSQDGKTLLKNLQSQTKGVQEWGNNLSTISKTCSSEFVQYLADMGINSAAEIEELAKMTPEKLKEYEDAWRERNEAIEEAAEQSMSGMKQQITDAQDEITTATKNKSSDWNKAGMTVGKAMGQGMVDGMKNYKTVLMTETKNMCTAALEAMRKALDINSPSKKARRLFQYVGEGGVLGLEDSKKAIEQASYKLANTSLGGMVKGASYNGSQPVTSNVINYDKLAKAVVREFNNATLNIDRDGLGRIVQSEIRRTYA